MTYSVCATRLHALALDWREQSDKQTVGPYQRGYAAALMLCADALGDALPPPIDPAELTDPQFPLLSAWITRWIEEHEDLRPEAMCAALEAMLAEVKA